MKTEKRQFGDWGEEQAAIFLSGQGYDIVERNYRTRRGEIDIIAWHVKPQFGRTLCFIEVKTRRAGDGSAERATNQQKLQRLFMAARDYCLREHIPLDAMPMQFEQVSVLGNPSGGAATMKHDVIIVE